MNTVYLDMDGVVADFEGVYGHLAWNDIEKLNHVYRHIPKTDYADAIVNVARKFRDELGYKLYFLTAVSKKAHIPDVYSDKVKWAHEYFPDIEVRFGPDASEKKNHCNPGDILVDDKASNCRDWESVDGIAVRAETSYNGYVGLKDLFSKSK
jgi:5'(3')-deoxyribonucleotidase